MAASVISCFAAPRDSEASTLDEPRAPLHRAASNTTQRALTAWLAADLESPPLYESTPPTYECTLRDQPPQYATTQLCGLLRHTFTHMYPSEKTAASDSYCTPLVLDPPHTVAVDLSRVEGIRNHVSKKAKQAAKKAQQARWADSGDEGEGEGSKDGGGGGGDGEQNGSGGSAGGGAGGDGGGADDGDGDGWDDAPGKKNKKKGKKGKKDEDEEEEAEQEDAGASGATTTTNFWDNLDLNSAGDANPDDEWGTASTGKKGKKGKKGKADPPPPPLSSADKSMDPAFDDINLDAPQLDLSFGGNDNKGNDYSFGNWGSGWGFSGLGGGANKSTPDANKDSAMDDGSLWNMGAGKKDAKKKTTKKSTGFDFGFGGADDLAGEDATTAGKDDKEDDALAGFTTATSKKDKKGKKTIGFAALDDIAPDPPVVVVPESDPKDDDSLNPWGATKKDKKGTKKAAATKEPEPPPPPPPPEPAEAEDIWSSFSKTDKKKAKKDDKPAAKPVVVVPEPEPVSPIANGDDGWDVWGGASKKDKKKKKGGKEEPTKEEPIVVVPETDPADEFLSFGSTSTKKDKKKSSSNPFGAMEDLLSTDQTNSTPADDGWNWASTTKTDKKKSKKGIVEEPPPPPPAPEPPAEEAKEDDWMSNSIWGNSKKDKKGKKGDLASDKKATNGDVAASKSDPVEEPAFDWGNSFDSKKDKKRKDPKKEEHVSLSLLQENSVPDDQDAAGGGDDDIWGWASSKKDKKKGKTASAVPPPVPTPPNLGLTPGNSPPLGKNGGLDNVDSFDLDDWSNPTNGKAKGKKDVKKSSTITGIKETKADKKSSKDLPKEDDPIIEIVEETTKPSPKEEKKSFWSSFGGSTTTKAKTAKEIEKEKKEKELEEAEKAQKEKEEAELAEAAAKKDAKKKGITASTKADSKTSKKAKEDEAAAAAAAEAEKPPSPPAEEKKAASKKGDAWSFWGSSATTNSKDKDKEAEKEAKKPAVKTDKEIGNDKPANQKAAVVEPYPAKINKDTPLKSTTSAAAGGKTTAPPAASDKDSKLKEKEKDKKPSSSWSPSAVADKAKDKKAVELPPSPPPDFEPKAAANKVESKGSTVTRKPVGKLSPTKVDVGSEAKSTKLSSKVPGGFPLDDNVDLMDDGFADMDWPKKADKASKKADKKTKAIPEPEPVIVEPPSPPVVDAKKKPLSDSKKKTSSKSVEPAKLPTPPPEPEIKASKKERPRVVRDESSASWGFWGASGKPPSDSDKKDSRAKADPDVKKDKLSPPGLSRSKSERKSSAKDAEKLSGSGSDEAKKSDSRPKASRGMSFSSIFGSAPPPARSASKRASATKSSSRRRSVDVDAGLPSPPPEDDIKVPGKAAKTLGMDRRDSMPARSQSTREKSKKRTEPDPYALDDADGLIMVDPPSKDRGVESKRKSTKSKRDRSGEDAVLVEAPMVDDAVDSAPANKSSRPPMKRSASSAKKTEGFLGLFGATRKKERRPSASEEDDPKRLRRESRRVRRSEAPAESKDVSPDAPGDPETEAEAEARRADRRARRAEREAKAKEQREAELAEQAEREARQKEKEREKTEARRAKAKEERARQRQEDEDRRARRAAKDEVLAAQVTTDDQDDSERRRRRRVRASMDAGDVREPARLRHTDRRRSYQPESKNSPYLPDDYDARRNDRRARRSAGVTPIDPSSKSYRRKSGVEDYFDPRNGDKLPPLSRVGTDKTASWVHSVNVEPPPPPPLVGTVLEPEPEFGPSAKVRKEPRRSEYRRERERERAEKRSDEGSGGRRRSEYYDDGAVPLTSRGLDAITGTGKAGPKGAAGFLRKMGF